MKARKIIILTIIFFILMFCFVYLLPKLNKITEVNNPKEELGIEKPSVDLSKIELLDEVSLTVEKDVYLSKDEISLVVFLENSFVETKDWQVVYYLQSIDNSYSTVGEIQEITIEPRESAKVEFSSIVDERIASGNYVIKIEILERGNVINRKSKSIKIEGAKKNLQVNLQICADENCNEEKVVFLQHEKVYIRINTVISIPNLEVKIKHSSQENWENLEMKENISLFVAEKIGTYKILAISRNNEEYHDVQLVKEFAVIGLDSNIESESKCSVDGDCGEGENIQNCPQDCL